MHIKIAAMLHGPAGRWALSLLHIPWHLLSDQKTESTTNCLWELRCHLPHRTSQNTERETRETAQPDVRTKASAIAQVGVQAKSLPESTSAVGPLLWKGRTTLLSFNFALDCRRNLRLYDALP